MLEGVTTNLSNLIPELHNDLNRKEDALLQSPKTSQKRLIHGAYYLFPLRNTLVDLFSKSLTIPSSHQLHIVGQTLHAHAGGGGGG